MQLPRKKTTFCFIFIVVVQVMGLPDSRNYTCWTWTLAYLYLDTFTQWNVHVGRQRWVRLREGPHRRVRFCDEGHTAPSHIQRCRPNFLVRYCDVSRTVESDTTPWVERTAKSGSVMLDTLLSQILRSRTHRRVRFCDGGDSAGKKLYTRFTGKWRSNTTVGL